jgi:hypothetical protein
MKYQCRLKEMIHEPVGIISLNNKSNHFKTEYNES